MELLIALIALILGLAIVPSIASVELAKMKRKLGLQKDIVVGTDHQLDLREVQKAKSKREDGTPSTPADEGNTSAEDVRFINHRIWHYQAPNIAQRNVSDVTGLVQTTSEIVETKKLMSAWRRSIVGLARLADNNLQAAKQLLEAKNFRTAAQAACTSIENISRALMHCYAFKADIEPGQEEPLTILSAQFSDPERKKFEKTIDEIALIHNAVLTQSSNETAVQQIVRSASGVVTTIKQMIRDHFANEIPELQEACPRCAALSASVFSFNREIVIKQCNICRYKWTEMRF